MNARFVTITQRVDLILAELNYLAARGPHFRILHKHGELGSICLPGELVIGALLVYRSRETSLRLPLSLLLLFNYLADHAHATSGQSAAEIVAALRTDLFYVKHGANTKTDANLTRRFSRSAIKEYVKRLRRALKVAFDEAGLRLDPYAVLVSVPTEGNEVRYRLKATIEWIHI